MDTQPKQGALARAGRGLLEGAAYGGILLAISRTIRGGLLAGLMGAAVGAVFGGLICAIGRGVSGRLGGAVAGAVAGLFLGMVIGHELMGYGPTDAGEEIEPGSSGTIVLEPRGQQIGSLAGIVVGATAGAFAERLVRKKFARPSPA